MRHPKILLPVLALPFLTFLGLMFASTRLGAETTGLLLLLYLLALPPILWSYGRRLRKRLAADPPSRSEVLVGIVPVLLSAGWGGGGLLVKAAWLALALLPYLALWFGLGLHRRDARLT